MSLLNPFVMRRTIATVLCPVIACVLFFVGLIYYQLIGAIFFMFVALLLCYFLGRVLLLNPFTAMLEGKGILVLNIDSTGVIRPFIVSVMSPFIQGKLNGRQVKDAFDRSAVFHMAAPVDLTKPTGKLWWKKKPKSKAQMGVGIFEDEMYGKKD